MTEPMYVTKDECKESVAASRKRLGFVLAALSTLIVLTGISLAETFRMGAKNGRLEVRFEAYRAGNDEANKALRAGQSRIERRLEKQDELLMRIIRNGTRPGRAP